jgi:hypothetical protein
MYMGGRWGDVMGGNARFSQLIQANPIGYSASVQIGGIEVEIAAACFKHTTYPASAKP